MLFALGFGGGLLYVVYKLLPYLIEMTKNLIQLSLLGIVLFVIVFMILDPQVRNLAWYLYKSSCAVLRACSSSWTRWRSSKPMSHI